MDYTEIPKSEGRDLTQSVNAGLRLDISDALKVEQRYSVSTASRLAHDSDSIKWNAHIDLDYKVPVKPDLTFRCSYDHTGFAHDVSTQRFSEHNFQTELLWKF